MSAEITNLLRHLSECNTCHSAAVLPSSTQCATYQRLSDRLTTQLPNGERGLSMPVHLTAGAIEEYCFDRLPIQLEDWCQKHITECDPCRRRVESNALTIVTIQNAFLNRQRQEALTPKSRSHTPKLFPVLGPSVSDQSLRMSQQFKAADLLAARAKLPVSRMVATRCLATLQNEDSSLSEIVAVVMEDPIISAHLMKVANTALVGARREIRSVSSAISQIGFERTKVHIWGISAKALFSSPRLSEIWNHSIHTAQAARNLAEASGKVDPDEACLTGLVHDIGQLVLNALGQPYENGFTRLRAKGAYAVDIERQLCGSTHAQIGADLLASWSFPADMVETVRQHHTPMSSNLALTSLLYIAESWVETPEDIFDPAEHTAAMWRLQLDNSDLAHIASQCAPDLDLLRIAA